MSEIQPAPDECHHFSTRKFPTEDGTIRVFGVCSICELVIGGLYIGRVPPCAVHWHMPKE